MIEQLRPKSLWTRWLCTGAQQQKTSARADPEQQHSGSIVTDQQQRLQGQMREVDLVARLGGDEFVVLLAGAHNTAQLTAMARRLVEAVHQPVQEGDLLLRVDASIGIARCPAHGRKLNELLRHADAAMYRAKQSGSGFAFYEPAQTAA